MNLKGNKLVKELKGTIDIDGEVGYYQGKQRWILEDEDLKQM